MAEPTVESPTVESPTTERPGLYGRVRRASVSLINANPQLGMWQASGLAIAQAPNLSELRDAEAGGDNIQFNAQGHSVRRAVQEEDGQLTLVNTNVRVPETLPEQDELRSEHHHRPLHQTLHDTAHHLMKRRRELRDKHKAQFKEKWGPTILNGLKVLWRFFLTPSGFFIIIYFLNIVAWGGMLFLLELKAAPAMNHPTADSINSPRKIWLEIDSQILNALFCVTGFGLAPWRFRDLYYYIRAKHFKSRYAMQKLYLQNKSWFRPPPWATTEPPNAESTAVVATKDESAVTTETRIELPVTFTGERAPPTPMWRLAFTIWMMVLNTLIQAVLCFFMWHYNRIKRPGWATGTFIGLGCGVAMLAGLMSYWEGRKVKKIEGPEIEVEEKV